MNTLTIILFVILFLAVGYLLLIIFGLSKAIVAMGEGIKNMGRAADSEFEGVREEIRSLAAKLPTKPSELELDEHYDPGAIERWNKLYKNKE